MKLNSDNIEEYKKLIEKGDIQKIYKSLIDYMLFMKTHFKNKYSEYFVGNIYQGYMDMTYFSFTPEQFINKKLKIAIVFQHKTTSYEVWLAGYNKQIQTKYWNLFKERNYNKYNIAKTIKSSDAILVHILVYKPNFNNINELTNQIEAETLKFINDIEIFLSQF